MKPILIISALLFSLNVVAQSTQVSCALATSSVQLGSETKQSYEGSVCFTGSGEISNQLKLAAWPWLNIAAEDTILVSAPINFSEANAKVYSAGNVHFSNIAMDGGDTLFVRSGLCKIDAITSENSLPDNWNTIVIEDGAELYWSGLLFASGSGPATISTGGVKGSKVKIVSANEHTIGLNHRD